MRVTARQSVNTKTNKQKVTRNLATSGDNNREKAPTKNTVELVGQLLVALILCTRRDEDNHVPTECELESRNNILGKLFGLGVMPAMLRVAHRVLFEAETLKDLLRPSRDAGLLDATV